MEKVYYIIQIIIDKKVNLKIIKKKEKEYIIMMMEKNMMVNGKMI